jgi:hypothetical protein
MEHITKPTITGGHTLELDYTNNHIRFDFNDLYVAMSGKNIDYIENLWGNIIPYADKIPYNTISYSNGFYNFRTENLENDYYNFLDLTITVNLQKSELEYLQEIYNNQNIFTFTWTRFINIESVNTYNSHQARIAKFEIVFEGEETTKVKLRIIMPCFNLYLHDLTPEKVCYYKAEWKTIFNNRFDFVLKTYLIYILLHQAKNITDRELLSVGEYYTNLGLFDKVSHINNPTEIKIILTEGDRDFKFTYTKPNI